MAGRDEERGLRAAGWPVGSGATESAHDPVMQARLKWAGMRWARA